MNVTQILIPIKLGHNSKLYKLKKAKLSLIKRKVSWDFLILDIEVIKTLKNNLF